MALRAGYYGIKKRLIAAIQSFMTDHADDVSIKSIGDGLTLSEAGQLSAGATSINYSTTEQNTGVKWTDGKDIYQKTYEIATTTEVDQSGKFLTEISDYASFETVISAYAIGKNSANLLAYLQEGGLKLYANPSCDCDTVTVLYTKKTTNSRNKKGGAK